MKYLKYLVLALAFTLASNVVHANDTIVGRWQTFSDEETDALGNPIAKSVVEIWQADTNKEENGISLKKGFYYGRVIKISDPARQKAICDQCSASDPRKNQATLGMLILTDIEMTAPGVWEGSKGILDPKKGKVYDVKLWLEDGKLKVRGYIAFLYRTQEWLPFKD